MAYSFLNTTTYTNQLAAQQQLMSQIEDAIDTPLGAGFSLNSYDSDLIEIVASESVEPQGNVSMTEEVETPDIDEPEVDDRADMDLINSMFTEEAPAPQRVRTRTIIQEDDDEEEAPASIPTNGK